MALEQKLKLKLAQKLVMTPSLQQAIKLLQLSRLELQQAVAQELQTNPLLELDEESEVELEPEVEEREEREEKPEREDPLPSPEESYGDIDIEAFFSDYLPDPRLEGGRSPVPWEEQPPLENAPAAPPCLYDHLVWQLGLMDLDRQLRAACEFVVGNLNEDGYLEATDAEMARASGLPEELIKRAVEVVKRLDPPGVGCRTLQECLLVQVNLLIEQTEDAEEKRLLKLLARVLSEHWDNLLHQRWTKIAEALGVEVQELKPVVEVLKRLDPKPGRAYARQKNMYVEPDVFVHEVGGEYVVTLNEDGLPKLRINTRYLDLASAGHPEIQQYVKEKMRNAMWLMKSIDQRQRTLYKVASSIVKYQQDFFRHGIEFLKPLVLRQVAEDVGLHESTVSRVVSNKYMHTPRGVFPMKFFFHSSVDSARGENVSSVVVKERIRKLIENEDRTKPLSDSKIMKLLQREGIRVARRTVAKYREEMGIPSSDKRKRVF